MIKPKSFRYEQNDGGTVGTITLNRPERLNALTFEVYDELRDTFRALNEETTLRTVVITGSGKGFCSGGDVEDIIGALFDRDYSGLLEFTRLTCDLILAMRQCRKPIIAALNGTVAGAGAVIALAADIRIATDNAKVAFLFSKVGLCGADMGAAWLLPRVVGQGLASELLMTGEFVDPQRALAIGLYNEILPQAELDTRVAQIAKRLAQGPSLALELTKDALNREASMDLVSALENEAQVQATCMTLGNFREAYQAWREGRRPRFE